MLFDTPVTSLHPSARGTLNEVIAAADLLSRGYEVFQPFGNASCDLLAMKNGKIWRIEVKTGYRNAKNGRFYISPHNSKSGKFDVLAVVDRERQVVTYAPDILGAA